MQYIIILGNYLNGIEESVGTFYTEYEADEWLVKNKPDKDIQTKVIPISRPDDN